MMDCCLGAPPFKRLVVEVPRDVAGIAGPGTSGVSGWCKWFAFSVDVSAFSSGIQICTSSGGLGVRCVEKLECLAICLVVPACVISSDGDGHTTL
jgi:hypothetical protein